MAADTDPSVNGRDSYLLWPTKVRGHQHPVCCCVPFLLFHRGVTLQSEMLPPSEISEQIADYQADIWSNIRFQISDARCRCHNLSLDPDFRFQISDFWAKIYPRTRFLVRFQISDFTCPDQAPSHGPPTSFAGWRITRQSAICNLLEHNAKRKQPGRFRSQFASSDVPGPCS